MRDPARACASRARTRRSCSPSCSSSRRRASRRSIAATDVEYAVYGAPGELPALPGAAGRRRRRARRDHDDRGRRRLVRALAQLPQAGDDRRAAARAPAVGAGAARRRGLLDIVIDPAQAFGTGAHDTTRLCLEALLELEPGGAARSTSAAARACSRSRRASSAGRRCSGSTTSASPSQATRENAARQRRRRRGAPLRPPARRPAAGARRPSSRTCCARCCCTSPSSGFAGEPPRVLDRQRPARARGRRGRGGVRARHGLRERARRHGGEWAALHARRADELA